MDIQSAAAELNGSEYGEEGSAVFFAAMKEHGLVAVFGASDDLMEFRGAIYDEIGAYDGTTAYLTSTGLIEQCDCECPHYEKALKSSKTIEACWDGGEGYAWTYTTQIAHATFDVLEGGEPYCRGIVFSMESLRS